MKKSIDVLKSYFNEEDKPSEGQFADLIDSYYHKDSGIIIKDYTVNTNGNVTFNFSDNTSTTIEKLTLPPSMPLHFIDGLVEALKNKVDKETGKQLTDENFTSVLKSKLVNLKDYVHPSTHTIAEIEGLQGLLAGKVDKARGKQLTDENFTTQHKEKLENIKDYEPPVSESIAFINGLQEALDGLSELVGRRVEIQDGKDLSTNDFTNELKEKLVNSGKQNFTINEPVEVGYIAGKSIYEFFQLVERPSFQDVLALPIPAGSEILSFSANYKKDIRPFGDFVFIEAKSVKTPQNRFNLVVNDVYYNDATGKKVSVTSFKADLVEEIQGGGTRTLTWTGNPVTLNIDTTYSRSFRIKPKKIELSPNKFCLAQTDLGSLLNFPAQEGDVNGKVRYDRGQPVYRRKIENLPLNVDTQLFQLDTKNLYADTENLYIHCKYLTE